MEAMELIQETNGSHHPYRAPKAQLAAARAVSSLIAETYNQSLV